MGPRKGTRRLCEAFRVARTWNGIEYNNNNFFIFALQIFVIEIAHNYFTSTKSLELPLHSGSLPSTRPEWSSHFSALPTHAPLSLDDIMLVVEIARFQHVVEDKPAQHHDQDQHIRRPPNVLLSTTARPLLLGTSFSPLPRCP